MYARIGLADTCTNAGLRITGRRHKNLGAASNEKQTAALRSIHECADTSMLQNQDNPRFSRCGVVDRVHSVTGCRCVTARAVGWMIGATGVLGTLYGDVVDETGLAEPRGREQAEGRVAFGAVGTDGGQGVRITGGDVVDGAEASRKDGGCGSGGCRIDGRAGFDGLSARGHGGVEGGRDGAFGRREVSVARGQSEAIGLAAGGGTNDRQGQVEVADHLSEDCELLVVLFAEDRDVGCDLTEEFAAHGCDAAEKVGAKVCFEAEGCTGGFDFGGKAWGIHFSRRGGPYGADCEGGELRAVGVELAGVAVEVFVGGELLWVDEDRDDDVGGFGFCQADEVEVTVMECAHRRNEGNGTAVGADCRDVGAEG